MTKFLRATLIRAIRTVAQTAVSLIGTTAAVLHNVNWAVICSGSALAGLLSILTAVATGLPEA